MFLEGSSESRTAEFLIPEVVKDLIHGGAAEVRVLPTTSPCAGVTHPEDAAFVSARLGDLIEQGEYPGELVPQATGGSP